MLFFLSRLTFFKIVDVFEKSHVVMFFAKTVPSIVQDFKKEGEEVVFDLADDFPPLEIVARKTETELRAERMAYAGAPKRVVDGAVAAAASAAPLQARASQERGSVLARSERAVLHESEAEEKPPSKREMEILKEADAVEDQAHGVEARSFDLVARVRRFLGRLREGESLDGALREFQPGSLAPAARSPFPSLDLSEIEMDYCNEIGKLAEKLVFEYLVGKFGQRCHWLSRFASEYGAIAAEEANDSAGFDMLLTGTDGRDLASHLRVSFSSCVIVGSAAGMTELAIEVKGHVMTAGSCII